MVIENEMPLITVPVTHYDQNGMAAAQYVNFKVSREEQWFKAIPLMSAEDRSATGLPEELLFVYASHCITGANDMEDESLSAIKQIVQELEARELL